MKSISAADWKRLSKLGDEIETLKGKFEDAWNEIMQPLIDKMNEKRDEARVVLDDFVSAAEDWRGERSDKWHDSNAASEHETWLGDISRVRDTLENEQEIETPELDTVDEWLTALREELQQKMA